MPMFRKKPVVIEAVQVPPMTTQAIDLCEVFDSWMFKNQGAQSCRYDGDKIIIPTLEGDMTADRGDWIIKGLKGELYPCKPDIFEMTYELVEEAIE